MIGRLFESTDRNRNLIYNGFVPTLSIALLGTYAVTLAGRPVTAFAYDKVRGLLAYLAVEADRPHRRDHLATLFWPEQDRRSALQSLSQALYQLRRVLGDPAATPPFLLITPQTIQFNPASDHWLDTQEFTSLLDACHAHRHAQQVTCPECLARLQQAVALVHGSFLEGFSLPDSPDFDEWALFQRERLQRLATEALRTLANGCERRGDAAQALVYAQRWLALDPWQEEAQRQVMRVLAASGQRSAALAQFESCRRILAVELGVEPAPETVALAQRIRDALDGQGSLQGTRHNLPAPLTPLIGRDHELNSILQRLQDPACRLVSLVGPGGSGKTRLALEAAGSGPRQLRRRYLPGAAGRHRHDARHRARPGPGDGACPGSPGGRPAAAPRLPARQRNAPRAGQFRAPV